MKDTLLAEWEGVRLLLQQSEWKQEKKGTKILLPYYAFGEDGWLWINPQLKNDDKWGARLYLTLKGEAASFLVSKIPFYIESHSGFFQLKIASSPQFYTLRRDSCVIYFKKEDRDSIFGSFASIFKKLHGQGGLTQECIPLAEKIMPGIFYAEDPKEEMSFGMHRSYLIAKGFDHCEKKSELSSFFRAVQDIFSEEGLSPEQPWRQP